MSREQLTDQQAEHSAAAQGSQTTEETYGLPPHVYGPLMKMGPGDAEALHDLLTNFPGFRQQILSAAVSANQMGNIAIQRAIDMTKRHAVGRPGALTQEQIRPGGEFELEGGPPAAKPAVVRPGAITQEQMRPGGEFELESSAAPAPKAEPAWVAGARKFNDVHAELVSEFNDLTKFKCALDDGIIDPQAVAAWQRQHGLDADGKVGPHTLAAARHAVAKAGPAGTQADARIPV